LDTLDKKNEAGDFISLATQLADLRQSAMNPEKLVELDRLSQVPLLWENREENEFLSRLFQTLYQRRERYLRFREMLANNRLDQAEELINGIARRDVDRGELEDLLEQFRQAEADMIEMAKGFDSLSKAEELYPIMDEIDIWLSRGQEVANLKIRRGEGQKAQYWVERLKDWQMNLKQAKIDLDVASRARTASKYADARDHLKSALINIPEYFTGLRHKLEVELKDMRHLATVEEPYLEMVGRAKESIDRGELEEALGFLKQARNLLKGSPSGLDEKALEEKEALWLERLEKEVMQAWNVKRYEKVDEFLKLGEGMRSAVLEEYHRLLKLNIARETLDKGMRDANIGKVEKAFDNFARMIDPKDANEYEEKVLWEKRLDALKLVKWASELLRAEPKDRLAMEECLKELEVRAGDYWPNPDKANECLKDLKMWLKNAKH
jgi:hypothetical protein